MNTPDDPSQATAEPKVIQALVPLAPDHTGKVPLLMVKLRFVVDDAPGEDGDMPQARLQISQDGAPWEDAFMPGAAADVVGVRMGYVTSLDGTHLAHGQGVLTVADPQGSFNVEMAVPADDIPLLGAPVSLLLVQRRKIEGLDPDAD